MNIGVDYYPEHWNPVLWTQDADLMKKTGVKLVRIGEFAWCRLEPTEGTFDFEWLDQVIELFSQRNIDIVLCTPTNCPPLWLYERYPDTVQTGKDGNKTAVGIRGHRCYNQPDFRRFAERIIKKMTERYGGHPSVTAWQIDNELESNFCFCDVCISQYRDWLRIKYGSLQELNQAYGNNVWSGEYSSWEQVKPPFGNYPQAWLNPAYMLDFYRYASDNVIKFITWQANLIRQTVPNANITTNTWFCEHMPDFYKEFSQLDFVAYDNYPPTNIPENSEECYSHAFHLDLMRGIKRQNFWIMEQLSGGLGSWSPMMRTTAPGMIKGYALQAFAHGADTVIHFRWRTAVSSAEMHWHGLIDHSNIPGRRFSEFSELCRIAEKLQTLQTTELHSDVAVLYSSDNEYAFKIQPQTDGMYYLEQLKLFHAAFAKYGLNVDVIGQHEDISDYKIIAAPELYITDAGLVQKLSDFARKGGTVILTNRTGVKNENNNCIMEQLPTVYRKMTGAFVEEYNPIGYAQDTVQFSDGKIFQCRQWCDVLCPESAETIAEYANDFYIGKAAVTKNHFGNGTVYYIGTVGEKGFYYHLIKKILTETKLAFIEHLPDNVEITTRTEHQKTIQFLFNNTDKVQCFMFHNQEVTLQPFEMQILNHLN